MLIVYKKYIYQFRCYRVWQHWNCGWKCCSCNSVMDRECGCRFLVCRTAKLRYKFDLVSKVHNIRIFLTRFSFSSVLSILILSIIMSKSLYVCRCYNTTATTSSATNASTTLALLLILPQLLFLLLRHHYYYYHYCCYC